LAADALLLIPASIALGVAFGKIKRFRLFADVGGAA
jgi:hypothetical protein